MKKQDMLVWLIEHLEKAPEELVRKIFVVAVQILK